MTKKTKNEHARFWLDYVVIITNRFLTFIRNLLMIEREK
jgi:hypothetical protein